MPQQSIVRFARTRTVVFPASRHIQHKKEGCRQQLEDDAERNVPPRDRRAEHIVVMQKIPRGMCGEPYRQSQRSPEQSRSAVAANRTATANSAQKVFSELAVAPNPM